MEQILSNIKECLLLFNYPLSNSMTEEELGDIFHISNRCFLISWMLKLLDDSYKDIVNLEENKQNEEVLGSLICELGFCSKRDQSSFMNGDLDVSKQLDILYKMFKYIKLVKEPSPENHIPSVSNGDITLLTNKNLNLFPMYGDIKTSNSSEDYSDKMRLSDNASGSENDLTVVSEVLDDIETLVKELRQYLPKLELAAQNLPKEDISSEEKIVFRPSYREILCRCNESIKQVNQFVQNLNTIEKFSKSDLNFDKLRTSTDESREMLNNLWEEILVTLRYQQMK
nr:uncharacterized protein LOC111517638 isoform X1 [Leptinotarsa decemlineata]XP_023029613.1 uncharacterized protein LOC111517638 isoform X2 [Leptinotarsa decemlineata]